MHPVMRAGIRDSMGLDRPKPMGNGWQSLETEQLQASLAANSCNKEQLMLAAEVVHACLACCSSWGPAGESESAEAADAGPSGDQATDMCSRLVEVCHLASAACKSLLDACGGEPGQQQQQQQPPVARAALGMCTATVGRFACACLRLAIAVLCDVAVAARLISVGQYTAAADLARAGVKHLVTALEQLCAQHFAAAGGADAEAEERERRELCSMLAEVCELLLQLAVGATDLVTGAGPPNAPREMGNLAALNLGWTCLGRLMVAPPPHARVAPPPVVRRAASCVLQQLAHSVEQLRAPGQEGRLRLVRFWLGSGLKVLGASAAATRTAGWAPLVSAALALGASECRGFGAHEGVAAGAVQELVLPKLVAMMLGALNEPGPEEGELQVLLGHIIATADAKGMTPGGPSSGQLTAAMQQEAGADGGLLEGMDPKLRLQAGVLLAGSLLQQAAAMQPPLARSAARLLLPWALRAAGAGAADALLREHPGGLSRNVRCAALAFLVGCAGEGPRLEAAWQEGVRELQLLAVSPHPLVARISSQVISIALQASAPGLLEQQLEASLALLDDLAASEALQPACHISMRVLAWRLTKHMANVLQSCSSSPSTRQFLQRSLLAVPAPPADACAAAALSARLILVRLAHLPPSAEVNRFLECCLEAAVRQLSTVLSWLQQTQQQQQQQQALLPVEVTLLECHLGWLLEAARLAAVQLQGQSGSGPGAVSAAGNAAMQQAAAAAISALALPGSGAAAQPAIQPPSCYVAPALRLVAAAGSVLQAAALEGLVEPLGVLMRGVQQQQQQAQQSAGQQRQQEGLLVDIAAAAGRLGGAQTQPQALFQSLLSHPHWAVRSAALDALVLYSRTSAVHSTFLGLIPPVCMASPNAASPAFVSVFKAHMERCPDEQAQRAHEEWMAGGGLEQLQQALRALPSGSGGGGGGGGDAWGPEDPFPEGVELSLSGYVEQRQMVASHAGQLERSLGPLVVEAKACIAAVTQALPGAEAAVGRLLSAVRAAAPCTLEEQQLIQGQAGQLLGDLVSVASRVRSLRDALDTVRGAAGGGGSGRL